MFRRGDGETEKGKLGDGIMVGVWRFGGGDAPDLDQVTLTTRYDQTEMSHLGITENDLCGAPS